MRDEHTKAYRWFATLLIIVGFVLLVVATGAIIVASA